MEENTQKPNKWQLQNIVQAEHFQNLPENLQLWQSVKLQNFQNNFCFTTCSKLYARLQKRAVRKKKRKEIKINQ